MYLHRLHGQLALRVDNNVALHALVGLALEVRGQVRMTRAMQQRGELCLVGDVLLEGYGQATPRRFEAVAKHLQGSTRPVSGGGHAFDLLAQELVIVCPDAGWNKKTRARTARGNKRTWRRFPHILFQRFLLQDLVQNTLQDLLQIPFEDPSKNLLKTP